MSSDSDTSKSTPTPRRLTPFVCQGCGCLCDDIEAETVRDRISLLAGLCNLGGEWFETQITARAARTAIPLDPQQIDSAASLLAAARFPALIGVETLTADAQRLAVRLAQRIGGVVASDPRPAIIARQEVGEVTCTLGEIRARADLVVFWFADPARTHPRHLERYSGDCTGRFIPNGRADRTLIVVDEAPTSTAAHADEFIELPANDEFAALDALRFRINKPDLGRSPPASARNTAWIEKLAARMQTAKYGVMVVDPSRYARSSVPLESAFKLVRDLNLHTCFVVSPLAGAGNVKGEEAVLQWLTGFPANVAFQDGLPTYDGNALSAEALLSRGRVDAAVVFGEHHTAHRSSQGAQIPTVKIGGDASDATIHLPAAAPIECSGTVFRMDGVPLPTTPLLDANNPTPQRVLELLIDALNQRARPV